jgi:Bifunctional DNA primase/polymerase, N-terminal
MSSQAQPNPPTVLEAALDYARCGIPVFPCNPIDKKPLTPNGFKDATRDETQILGWWQQYPNAMIGAPMGPASNLWAIDLDFDPVRKIDGKATLDQLVTQRGALPPTWATITPRGGRHLIFSWDPNVEIRNSASKIGPGIDVRGNGGYICLPPSRNATGGTYQWEPGGPQTAALAPPWLVALAKATKAKAWAKAALERECKAVAAAQPGTRNTTLNTAAFNLFQIVPAAVSTSRRCAIGYSRQRRPADWSLMTARLRSRLRSRAVRRPARSSRAHDHSRRRKAVSVRPFKSWTDNCFAS